MLFFRFFLILGLFIGGVLSADNILAKAYVKNDRLYLKFSQAVDPEAFHSFLLKKPNSYRYIFDLKETRLGSSKVPLGLNHSGVKRIDITQFHRHTVRIVIETRRPYHMVHGRKGTKLYNITLPKANKITKTIGELFASVKSKVDNALPKKDNKKSKRTQTHTTKKVNKSKETKEYSKTYGTVPNRRYTIVLDPGHGGHDAGAIGGGKREKDAVLQISKKVRAHLINMGFRVLMTRKSDYFVRLRNRTRFANKKHGDIFVSIHANSIASKKKRYRKGVETYFLQTTRSARAKRVAARENSVVLKRSDRLSKSVILNSVMTGPKIVLSNKLAIDIQRHMLRNLRKKYRGVEDGGVRPAPFWVLVGAEMPAVLIEVGYISNPMERKRLFSPRYQDLLAKGIAEGIATYLVNREREFE